MKSNFSVILLTLSFSSMAKEIEYLSAGGYYGNVVTTLNESQAEIIAAQGFGHQISSQLGRTQW
jgi:RNA binding exosome subunit